MSEITKNPPLACYYIAFIASLFGYSEVALHIGFILPACAVAAGVFYLAKYFGVNPLFASLCSIFSPVFLVSGTTLMCDIPMLAFWLWSIIFWLYGIKQQKRSYFLISAVLIALCSLTKYFGFALIPLLFIYSVAEKKRFCSCLFYLLIPISIMVLFQWYTFRLYGQGLFTNAAAYVAEVKTIRPGNRAAMLLVGLSFVGGCLLPCLFLSAAAWPRRVIVAGIPILAAFIVILSLFRNIDQTQIRLNGHIRGGLLIWFSILVAGGISILSLSIAEFWKNKNSDMLFLLLWITGTFLFLCFFNWTISARSLLPMVPAVSIIMTRRLQQKQNHMLPRHFWLLLPSAIIALAVTWADYSLARTAKEAAATICSEYGGRNNRPIWFQGHWGFQYYMQQRGCKPLDYNKSVLYTNDIIAIPLNNTNVRPLLPQFVTLVKTLRFGSGRWVTTNHEETAAGFYSSVWGIVPFALGPAPQEVYDIYLVKP